MELGFLTRLSPGTLVPIQAPKRKGPQKKGENDMGRSPELKKFLDVVTREEFGIAKTEAKKKDICVFCHEPVGPKDFRDEESREEYRISGICQKCQDKIFD